MVNAVDSNICRIAYLAIYFLRERLFESGPGRFIPWFLPIAFFLFCLFSGVQCLVFHAFVGLYHFFKDVPTVMKQTWRYSEYSGILKGLGLERVV